MSMRLLTGVKFAVHASHGICWGLLVVPVLAWLGGDRERRAGGGVLVDGIVYRSLGRVAESKARGISSLGFISSGWRR